MAMRRCPYCGRLNASGDLVCYNCDNPLTFSEGDMGETYSHIASPEICDEGSIGLEFPARRKRLREVKKGRRLSLPRLWIYGLVRKIFLLCLSLGMFFLMALMAIWVAYDNSAVAMVVVAIFIAAMAFSIYYPDVQLSRRYGSKTILASLLSNMTLMAIIVPLAIFYLHRRGYVSGTDFLLLPVAGTVSLIVLLGVLASWIASRRQGD